MRQERNPAASRAAADPDGSYRGRVSESTPHPPDAYAAALPRLEISGRLGAGDVAAVTMLTEAATEADGVRPLSEHVSLHLRYGGEGPDINILLFLPGGPDGDRVVGYAHLDPTDAVAGPAAELVVHPDHRRQGLGRVLVEAAASASRDGRLRLWAHGDHPAARRLADAMGFRVVRRLERLHRSLTTLPAPAALPSGVRLRAYRPGADDAAWLELNARAFTGHPEQGAWTVHDLQARMRESWFDPAGFLIAVRDVPGHPGQQRMIGFHWTKVHGGEPGHGPDRHGHEPIGEVYVVGVDPDERGQGLGRAITVAGLHWLRSQRLAQAMLYVESDNAAALAVYHGLGFTHWDTDVMFYRSLR